MRLAGFIFQIKQFRKEKTHTMKKTLKLIPALAMLLVSAILVSTSTYAWFSMNSKVTVTGMTVQTKVSNNLLIAPALDSDAKNGNQEANYVLGIDQVRKAILEPTSTVDGVNYWWTSTSNVDAQGDAKADTYTQYSEAEISSPSNALANTAANKTHYDKAFNTNYAFTAADVNNVCYGYLDYSFYIKATNADAANRALLMTKCNLLYKGASATDKAWRVAVFKQDAEKETAMTDALATADLVSILALSGVASTHYFTDGKAISANAAPSVDVSNFAEAVVIDNAIIPAETEYYKITVRLWLEGEDEDCKNDTYAVLTEDYRLDLEFQIGEQGTGSGQIVAVTAIGTTNPISAAITTGTTIGLTVSGLTGETVTSYQWYEDIGGYNDTEITSSGTSDTYTGTAGHSYYCVVTTAKGTTYRTNTVTLPTGG